MSIKNRPMLHQRGNPIANNPLMRKGGVHKKSRTSKRQKHKRETQRLVTKYIGTTVGGSGARRHDFSRKILLHKMGNGNNKEGGEGRIPYIPYLFSSHVFNFQFNHSV